MEFSTFDFEPGDGTRYQVSVAALSPDQARLRCFGPDADVRLITFGTEANQVSTFVQMARYPGDVLHWDYFTLKLPSSWTKDPWNAHTLAVFYLVVLAICERGYGNPLPAPAAEAIEHCGGKFEERLKRAIAHLKPDVPIGNPGAILLRLRTETRDGGLTQPPTP